MSTKLKCILLDDELPGLSYLKLLCEQLPEVEVVKAFNNPNTFLKEVSNLEFDTCIMDIEMPGTNGLQVAKHLHGKPIVFTTAYKEYATDAFDLNAIDYVLKPIKKERLQQAITKVKTHLSNTSKEQAYIQFNTDQGKLRIGVDQLLYIKVSETDSRDKIAHLSDNTIVTLKNLPFDKLQKLLPADQFVRINRGELVALRIVRSFSFNEIVTTLKTGTEENLKLLLSEPYREDFSKKLAS